MKILLVATGLGVGGAEAQVAGLAIRLRERGHEVHVTSLVTPAGMERVLDGHGVEWNCLGMRRGFPDPRAVVRLANWCRQYRPDVVHAHMIHANLLARVSRPFARMPVLICTAHSIYEMASAEGRIRERTWRELAYRWTDRFCDLTTSICEAGVTRYVQVGACPAGRILCVPNGIDTTRFRPDPLVREEMRQALGLGGKFAWLAVGRFEAAKDYDGLLEAVARLREGSAPGVLLMAGDGPLRPSMEALASRLGLDGWIRFLGVRRDVPRLMAAADGFVMSSFYEGMPLVLLEAQASSLPAVATEVGGVPEVVVDGVTGMLVPPRDSARLAEAMRRMMALTEEERGRMGESGRESVARRFDIDRIAHRWEEIYETLAAGRPVPGAAGIQGVGLRYGGVARGSE